MHAHTHYFYTHTSPKGKGSGWAAYPPAFSTTTTMRPTAFPGLPRVASTTTRTVRLLVLVFAHELADGGFLLLPDGVLALGVAARLT